MLSTKDVGTRTPFLRRTVMSGAARNDVADGDHLSLSPRGWKWLLTFACVLVRNAAVKA
jgi:hypothetical protein